jgi:hypothetical protein
MALPALALLEQALLMLLAAALVVPALALPVRALLVPPQARAELDHQAARLRPSPHTHSTVHARTYGTRGPLGCALWHRYTADTFDCSRPGKTQGVRRNLGSRACPPQALGGLPRPL